MRTLTISCLVAVLATLTVVGSANAASTSVDKWFRMVEEIELMVEHTDTELLRVETKVEHVDAVVDALYLAYESETDLESIRAGLDIAFAKTEILLSMYDDCVAEIRACDQMLVVVLAEAQRLQNEGDQTGILLQWAVKDCENERSAVEARCSPCENEILQIRQRIEDLYALLPLP